MSETKTIWIVESGSWADDVAIEGVFMDEETAKAYVNAGNLFYKVPENPRVGDYSLGATEIPFEPSIPEEWLRK